MPLNLTSHALFEVDPHRFEVLDPADPEAFLREVAIEYVRLRSETAVALRDLSLDGVEIVAVDALKARLKQAVIPPLTGRPMDVVRSDFGEVVAYMLLEADGVRFGYRGVRDRETVKLPGRGIDAVGLRDGEPLTLLLGEVKVSDEDRSPPRVVDTTEDCLRKQHRGHLKDKQGTIDKLWNLSRFSRDADTRDLLLRALLLFEQGKPIQIVCSCFLIRSAGRFKEVDFGSFRKKPGDFKPGVVRFHLIRTPADVETTIARWHAMVMEEVGRE